MTYCQDMTIECLTDDEIEGVAGGVLMAAAALGTFLLACYIAGKDDGRCH